MLGIELERRKICFFFFHVFERKIARLEEARDRYVWRLQGTTFSPLMLIIAYKYWILL